MSAAQTKTQKIKEYLLKHDLEIIDHSNNGVDANIHEVKCKLYVTRKIELPKFIQILQIDFEAKTLELKIWFSQLEYYCL